LCVCVCVCVCVCLLGGVGRPGGVGQAASVQWCGCVACCKCGLLVCPWVLCVCMWAASRPGSFESSQLNATGGEDSTLVAFRDR